MKLNELRENSNRSPSRNSVKTVMGEVQRPNENLSNFFYADTILGIIEEIRI